MDNNTQHEKDVKQIILGLKIDKSLLDDQLSYLYSLTDLDIEKTNLTDGIINILETIREAYEKTEVSNKIKLSLEELLNSKENRNDIVLDFNEKFIKGDPFSDIYGGICGSENGVLREESLDCLFEMSNIEICTFGKRCVFFQDEEIYTVCLHSDRFHEDDIYFDFNTIKKVPVGEGE